MSMKGLKDYFLGRNKTERHEDAYAHNTVTAQTASRANETRVIHQRMPLFYLPNRPQLLVDQRHQLAGSRALTAGNQRYGG
jgi:hypothetical protein